MQLSVGNICLLKYCCIVGAKRDSIVEPWNGGVEQLEGEEQLEVGELLDGVELLEGLELLDGGVEQLEGGELLDGVEQLDVPGRA